MGKVQDFIRSMFGGKAKTSSLAVLSQQMRGLFSRSIYNIPEVRTAINTVAETLATVPIWVKRIKDDNGEVVYLNNNLDFLLNYSPNPMQNKAQFWSMIVTKMLLNNAVAIEIVYDHRERVAGLYPLPFYKSRPQDDFETLKFADDPDQKLYLLENVILLTRFSDFGRGTENHATDLYEQIIQAIQQRAVENTKEGNKIVAAYTRQLNLLGSRAKAGDTSVAVLNEVNKQVENSSGATKGFVALDGATSITALNIPEVKIEKELLAIIIKAVYNYFGISQAIIDGTASEMEWGQFIAKFPRFCCSQMEQECTRKLLSEGEVYHGNRIEFDYLSLQVVPVSAKTALMNNGVSKGYLNIDECREMLGYPPLPNGLGSKHRGDLNSVALDLIDEYQSNKSKQTAPAAPTAPTMPLEPPKAPTPNNLPTNADRTDYEAFKRFRMYLREDGGDGLLRLPYALAKEKGLDTEGMSPSEVWDMLKGEGVDPEKEKSKFQNEHKKPENKKELTKGERSPKLKETLSKKETQIKDGKLEKGVIIDKDGNVITEIQGKKSSVPITDRSQLKDNVFTHNHPSGCCAFSDGDVSVFVRCETAEMRAVTSDGRFVSLTRGDDYDKIKASNFSAAFNTIPNKFEREGQRVRKEKGYDYFINEFYPTREEYYNSWMRENAPKYGIIFEEGKI